MSSAPKPQKRKWWKKLFKRKTSTSLANSSGGTAHGRASNVPLDVLQSSTPQAKLVETLQISGRFLQSILPKIAGCVDENPAKMLFNILSIVITVRKEINDNKDELQTILEETLMLLSTVFAKMEVRPNSQSVVNQTVEQYEREIGDQLERVKILNHRLQSNIFRQVDYEHYKVQLADISRKIAGATNRFNIAMAGNTGIMVDELHDDKWEEKLHKNLQPSEMADHRFIHDGKSALKREVCTDGTRVNILNEIMEWANDSSSCSPPVFWLSGQAGSGKTTIAYTITKLFEQGQSTILGANFLCSRQFPETQNLQRIVPTIAFQLALNCKAFRATLQGVDTSGAIHSHVVEEQLNKFLFRPWMHRKHYLDLPTYLVVVDALDEIEGSRGSKFLGALLGSIEANNITGLKFLVTSRPDPDIATLCETFPQDAVCRLHKVPIEDAKLDIKTYLEIKLKNLQGKAEFEKLVEQAAGLFIYAATMVKILTGRKLSENEQLIRLRKLLSSTSSSLGSIDLLYEEIMVEAFADVDDDGDLVSERLRIFHTFLCSAERISTSVGALLVNADDETAKIVLERLHAVLYVQNDRVHWYHASFPDFIFARDRSNFITKDGKHVRFWCDAPTQHRLLSHGCFRIMQSKEIGLRFNMGDIKSSYLLDNEHDEELCENVDRNISPVLRYSCFHWPYHMDMSSALGEHGICREISDFLQIRVLFWIEVMNLLGSRASAVDLLLDAKEWVLKANDLPLADDLQEAANFATHFVASPAAESTPHLYISSLSAWQSVSVLSRNWKAEFSRIPSYKHTKGIVTPLMTQRFRESIKHAAFSQDARQVLVATDLCDHGTSVLDAATGQAQHVLTEKVDFVQFSQDGKRVVGVNCSSTYESVVNIWDASTFELLETFQGTYAAISRERTEVLLATKLPSAEYQIRVLDILTGAHLRTVAIPNANQTMLFSSATNKIVVVTEKSAQIWDLSSGYAQKGPTFEGHPGYGTTISISSDNKIVTGYWGDHSQAPQSALALRVWDASSGNALAMLPHDHWVKAVNFSQDNTRVVSGSDDGTVRVWDIETSTIIRLLVHSGIVECVAFAPDDTKIISGSHDGSVHVWDAKTEQSHHHGSKISTRLAVDSVRVVAMSGDGRKLLSQSADRVQVWDAATGAEILTKMDQGYHRLIDEKFILSDLGNGVHEVWDATTGHEIIRLNLKDTDTHTFFVESLALSRSGRKIITCIGTRSRADGKATHWEVKIWDTETGQATEQQLSHEDPSFLAFSSDGSYLVAAPHFECVQSHFSKLIRDLTICNASTGKAIHRPHLQSLKKRTGHEMILHSSNGKEVVVFQNYPSISRTHFLFEVWDISESPLTSPKIQCGAIKSPSCPSNRSENHVSRFLCTTSLCLSNDGKKIALGCDNGIMGIWDVSDGSNIMMLFGHSNTVTSIQFSMDDKRVVSGSNDGSIRLWDLDMNADKQTWALKDDGWIISSQNPGHRLMWVHNSLEVVQQCNTLVIWLSGRGYGTVDFEGAMIGEHWEKCYTPQILNIEFK